MKTIIILYAKGIDVSILSALKLTEGSRSLVVQDLNDVLIAEQFRIVLETVSETIGRFIKWSVGWDFLPVEESDFCKLASHPFEIQLYVIVI
jgi:hypothetical protein